MTVEKIEDLNDPRLLEYRDLRNKNHYRTTGLFVAEGWRVVERLLNSSLSVRSVLISERREETMTLRFAERADVYILPDNLAQELVGYNFHAGVLASAQSPENSSLEQLLPRAETSPLIVCCPHLTGPDNLGSLIRLSAGFGVSGILLGQGSVDPYLRRCVRVSMGTIFRMPIRTTSQLKAEILSFKQQHGFEIVAAEKNERSISLIQQRLNPSHKPRLLMLGNEAEGLGDEWLELCDQVYHIPMAAGVDSLNIANAAGIFLYELTQKFEPTA